jgi:uncharacterized RDD family membrane protein YckC
MVMVCLRAKKEIYLLNINAQQEESVMPYCKKCGSELPEGAKYCPVCGTPVVMEETPASVQPTAAEASGLKLAFWGERFVAWLIDAIIIWIVTFILGLLNLSLTWWSGWPFWVPFFNLNGIIFFLYWMLMDGLYGQSFGKMIMRLKVTHLDGSQIGMGAAALESVGKAFLLPIDVLIGWILYPKRRQRIFNYLSETIVIKET